MANVEARDLTARPPGLRRRRFLDASFLVWGAVATLVGLGTLAALVLGLWADGGSRLNAQFFFSFPSSNPAMAGILSSWVGSLLVILTTAAIAIPLGALAGIYLEEYAPKNRVTSAIEIAVNNLAGVPSILYGLLALGLFVQALAMGQTILVAGLTLALLILPVIIVATREAVRGVPHDIRQAALALGATKWRTTQDHVLPYALPGMVTGVIIGLSRAIGETAPLILVGGLTFVAFLPVHAPGEPLSYTVGRVDEYGAAIDPDEMVAVHLARGGAVHTPEGAELAVAPGATVEAPAGSLVETTATFADAAQSWAPWHWLGEAFTVMPIQMFNWTSRPEEAFRDAAAAAGLVLLAITLLMNGVAIWLRARLRRKIRW
ncbi:MAG: phosphate ABC transporter permease PstA [Hyphomonadaceae bacterium]|nr:phosphate ABC transporter permease PstA [Hyphomonadaceae bacterium]